LKYIGYVNKIIYTDITEDVKKAFYDFFDNSPSQLNQVDYIQMQEFRRSIKKQKALWKPKEICEIGNLNQRIECDKTTQA